MKLYVLSIITVSTDVYNVENEVIIKKSEKEARESLKEVINQLQLEIEVADNTSYIDHYIDGVGSFYASILESEIEEEK